MAFHDGQKVIKTYCKAYQIKKKKKKKKHDHIFLLYISKFTSKHQKFVKKKAISKYAHSAHDMPGPCMLRNVQINNNIILVHVYRKSGLYTNMQ